MIMARSPGCGLIGCVETDVLPQRDLAFNGLPPQLLVSKRSPGERAAGHAHLTTPRPTIPVGRGVVVFEEGRGSVAAFSCGRRSASQAVEEPLIGEVLGRERETFENEVTAAVPHGASG